MERARTQSHCVFYTELQRCPNVDPDLSLTHARHYCLSSCLGNVELAYSISLLKRCGICDGTTELKSGDAHQYVIWKKNQTD